MDVIIIGAGISGLYLGLELLKQNKKVLVIEKSNRIGGRIYTKKFLNFTYESGAGRFSNKHVLLIQLLKNYDLYKDVIPIGSHNKKLDQYYKIIEKSLQTNKQDLSSISTLTYLNNLFGIDETKLFIQKYGYDGDIIESNAICGITMLMDDYTSESYFVLLGGLERLTQKLYLDFIQKGGKLILNTNVTDIYKSSSYFRVATDETILTSKKLVLAIGPSALKSLKPLSYNFNFINYIYSLHLLRTYFLYEKKQSVLKNLKKVITQKDIRFIIPINENIIMISYTDYKLAQKWYNLYKKDSDIFTDKILQQFYESTNILLQKPDQLSVEFWESGVHLWKPGFDQIKNYSTIIQPLDNLFLSNEAYSLHQGWVEGSLSIANDVLRII
jgi:hypothetical protein